jgi:hypothetical protein
VPKEYPRHAGAAQALYNAAVMLEKAKKPEAAAEAYLLVVDRYSTSPLAAAAAFTAAQVYESMAYFAQAAAAYELCAESFPDGEHAPDALFNAAVLRQALGEHRAAIHHYEAYAKSFRSRKDAEEVAFRVGVVYEQAGDDGRADRAYRGYLRAYRNGRHLVEAHVRSARTSLALGHGKRAETQLALALKAFKALSGDDRERALAWAAEARYHQGELRFKEYARVSLGVKPPKLKRALARKTELLGEAQDIYLSVVEMGDPQWATAALYRIGWVYEIFASAMREAPVPKGLSEAEAQVYRDELDHYVIDIEEQAIALYKTGHKKALELRVYNASTRLLREALARMAPSQVPPEAEARQDVRVGDRPPAPGLVVEVRRDE